MTDNTPQPPAGDVVVRRNADGRIEVNVPRSVVLHSPNGFECGYAGSGSADLALNILNCFVPPGDDGQDPEKCYRGTCSRFAAQFHQQFKFEFVATMPRSGGTIARAAIDQWIRARLGTRQEGA